MKLASIIHLPSFAKSAPTTSASDAESDVEPVLAVWAAFAGLLLFAGFVLYQKGIWAALLNADPTYLTALIVVLFVSATVWVGLRARTLTREYEMFMQFEALVHKSPTAARDWRMNFFLQFKAKVKLGATTGV